MIRLPRGLRGFDIENDENRMTKLDGMTNVLMTNIVKAPLRHSSFDISWSFVIRHWSFLAITHSGTDGKS